MKILPLFHFRCYSEDQHYKAQDTNRYKANAMSRLFFFIFLLFVNTGCDSQNPVNTPSGNTQVNKDEPAPLTSTKSLTDIPKGGIIETSTNKYPSKTYHFYDDQGNEVKTIREDQFPVKNPVLNLQFPEPIKETKDYAGRKMLVGFEEKTGKDKPLISTAEKVKILGGLSKFHLIVKNPNSATDILGSKRAFMEWGPTPAKRLIHIETAIIFDRNAEVIYPDDSSSPQSNSLLDCSYLSVYDNLGKIEHEKLISNKIINSGWASDDGRFLLCDYSLGYVWDEGFDAVAGSFCMVDFQNNEFIEIDISVYNAYTILGASALYGFFADGYFQMNLSNTEFLYLNPHTRSYFTVNFNKEQVKDKKALAHTSFMPYEGLKIDPLLYPKQSF
jgi:hypothetical protein